MKKVVIIGCGFAGVSAVERLSRFKREVEVTVIDRNPYFNFLPLLPDVIGRDIDPDNLRFPIRTLSEKLGLTFFEEEVTSVNLEKNSVSTHKQNITYDYLLIAAGSETNFYGNNEVKQCAWKLNDAADAALIRKTIDENDFDYYVISGGGYTGIEIATNLRRYLDKRNKRKPVIIVEKAPGLLGPLPEWMKEYVSGNLKEMNIEVLTNNSVAKTSKNTVTLANQKIFANAMFIWAAGVKTADFIKDMPVEKTPQGRLKVDEYLRIKDNCFVAGDSSYFTYKNGFLRMAVQFAITQGEAAAANIIRSIQGNKLTRFRPADLGYIIPMANNKSCGSILGANLKGILPTLLHYVMCTYRSCGIKNKLGLLKNLI